MRIPVIRHGQIAALAAGIALVALFLTAMPTGALALTTKSPEVVAAIEKGIKFLESNAANDEARIGGMALRGICLVNYTANPTYPKILEISDKIEKALGARDASKLDLNTWDMYSTGLTIIFFVEHDKEKHRSDIEFLLNFIRTRQKEKKDGAWGYPPGHQHGATCDTSMTQYGVLSTWIATKAGFQPPTDVESVANWLLRTQDPSGGFGYQGQVAPSPSALVAQSEVKPSMTAAGAGSLYICADLLGLIEAKQKRKDLAPAWKEVKAKDAAKEKPKTKIPVQAIRETGNRAAQWLEKNTKLAETPWVFYHLYALERCMSFREIFEQKSEEEPQWYNEGAAYLFKTQADNGSWTGQCSTVPDTAFSVLFLMRSTRKIIEIARRYDGGTMIGGRGIPKDTDRAILDRGHLVAKPLSKASGSLLDALDKPDSRDFDKSAELLEALPGDQAASLVAKYGDKIRDLVGNKSPEARLAAVKTLGKTRDLDNVETLIYALTDPDPRVVRAADEGLLRIRRITSGSTLPESFTEEDRRLFVERWKAWYQTIRPGVDMR